MRQNKLYGEAKYSGLEYNTRRHFLKECRTGLGMMALGSLLESCDLFGSKSNPLNQDLSKLGIQAPHFQGKAKSVIFLHMAGAPSQSYHISDK